MMEEIPEMKAFTFDHEYFSLKDGIITIHKGYAWDGVSGPTIDTKNTFIAGIVHDALYQAMRVQILPQSQKKVADKIFQRLLRKNGMSWFRAKYFYLGVKWFGKSHVKPKDHGEEMEEVFEV